MKSFSKRYVLSIAVFLAAINAAAQKRDSTHRDTLAFYKKIKKIAYKTKLSKTIYHSIFVDPAPQKYEPPPSLTSPKTEDLNIRLKGKIIRKINIVVYDPFGYSVNDTTKKDIELSQRVGNRLHVTTKKRIVKNLLLFKENDSLDLLKISESERLARSMNYITDARIYVKSKKKSDSVDITVVIKDKWSLEAFGDISPSQGNITLREMNIGGYGQRYQQYISKEFEGNYELEGKYSVANISKSFLSSELFYKTKRDFTQVGISLDRSLYSSLAKWAGGISLIQTWTSYMHSDTLLKTELHFPLHSFSTDEWVAKNLRIGAKKNHTKKIKNIIGAFRLATTSFLQRPSFSIDTGKVNSNSQLYLGSAGFSLSKFYKDQYIFRFGANEDIPEGLIVQFLYGILDKEEKERLNYAGIDVAYGKHINHFGYFSIRETYGHFFNAAAAENGVLNIGLTYFTDLLRDNHWYFRNFIYLKYVKGIRQPADAKITLRKDEMYGLISAPFGKSKLLFSSESVIYTPYNIIGFRFAFLALVGFGMVEPQNKKFSSAGVYQSYALGLLIRNENLLDSSFEVTYGFYPYLADGRTNLFLYNPVTSFTVKFRNFSIIKPEIVTFQ